MYQYFLIKETERKLDKEFAYSESRWGKQHAQKYAIQLKAKFTSIAKNPLIYPERSDILPGIRICNHKGNRIIFTVIEERKQVVVIGFLSSHQDINKVQSRITE